MPSELYRKALVQCTILPAEQRHCFLWPASVKWGQKVTYEGVRLGFNYGYLLHDEIGYLNKGNRKQVYWRDFTGTQGVDVDLLKSYLYEAEVLDREHKKLSKKVHPFGSPSD